jgi:hypothetical protein
MNMNAIECAVYNPSNQLLLPDFRAAHFPHNVWIDIEGFLDLRFVEILRHVVIFTWLVIQSPTAINMHSSTLSLLSLTVLLTATNTNTPPSRGHLHPPRDKGGRTRQQAVAEDVIEEPLFLHRLGEKSQTFPRCGRGIDALIAAYTHGEI